MASRLFSSRGRTLASSQALITKNLQCSVPQWSRCRQGDVRSGLQRRLQTMQNQTRSLASFNGDDLNPTQGPQQLADHEDDLYVPADKEIDDEEPPQTSIDMGAPTMQSDYQDTDGLDWTASPSISIGNIDPSLLPYLYDVDQIQSIVSQIESIPALTSVDVIVWIEPLMRSSSSLKTPEGAELTERLLIKCLEQVTELIDHIEDVTMLPYPNARMYTLAVSAWANAGTKHGFGAIQAQRLLEIMVDEYQRERDMVDKYNQNCSQELQRRVQSPRPDVINYTSVLNAYAKVGTIDAARHAQSLLDGLERISGVNDILDPDMDKDNVTGHSAYLRPNTRCYNTVINAWSRSGGPEAVSRVKSIIHRMNVLYEKTGNDRARPDVVTFNLLIESLAKVGQNERYSSNRNYIKEALEAEEILRDMYTMYEEAVRQGLVPSDGDRDDDLRIVRPNCISYNAVVNAWAKSKSHEGPDRAESILMAMLGKSNGETLPIMDGVRPDITTFSAAIHAWASSGHEEAGERAERLLKLMKSANVEPQRITINSVMNAWSRSGRADGAERVDAILNRMIQGEFSEGPNAISFSTAIFAWVRSPSEDGGRRAELLLNQMENLYQGTGNDAFQPNERCFTGVLRAWAERSGTWKQDDGLCAAERAEFFLDCMIDGMQPTLYEYHAVLDAWVRHNTAAPYKVERARALLHRMIGKPSSTEDKSVPLDSSGASQQSHPLPTTGTFNFVIAACVTPYADTPEQRREAFFTALGTYNLLCESHRIRPDTQTYELLFQVCSSLLPRAAIAEEISEMIFIECCRDGLLSNAMLSLASKCLPSVKLQNLIRSNGKIPDVRALPPQWSRNVEIDRERSY